MLAIHSFCGFYLFRFRLATAITWSVRTSAFGVALIADTNRRARKGRDA